MGTFGGNGGPGTAVRVTPSRQRADEWAVVLAAADVPYRLRRRLDGWALIVPPLEATPALEALDAYDRENAASRTDSSRDVAPSHGATAVGAAVALLLVGFFAVTGSRAGGSAWFAHGGADAARVMAGEWWRAVTALTLHADAPHVLGNAVAGALLVTAVCRQLGSGVGLWLLVLAGAGGNVLTAAAHGADHVSVGASTALFGAIGILAALRVVPGRVGSKARRWWVVIGAGLTLLALLGTGPEADVLAHVFGFLVGAGLGLSAALALRAIPPGPVQWLLAAAAGAATAGAWGMAF
ncbi:MAG TPA: rhomboid family intramembrane serine protease [Methylomirabilota bacterium]|nr:rhomboid family intramembrane serine protease [Methylomirabilota bacterium]